MNVMFPVLIIAIGIVVLVLGKRLAVMGAAVGALLGVVLLRLLNIPLTDVLLTLLIPGLLAIIGFFVAGFAKGIVNIVLLVLGADHVFVAGTPGASTVQAYQIAQQLIQA